MILEELIRQSKDGNRKAQSELVSQVYDLMKNTSMRYVKDRYDAEDQLHEALIELFKGLAKFEYQDERCFYAWAKRIVIFQCARFQRKRRVFVSVAEEEVTDITIEGDFFVGHSKQEIVKLILTLPEGYRTVFNMYMDGYSHMEIAGILKISKDSSCSQFSRAKALLKTKLLQNGISYVTQ